MMISYTFYTKLDHYHHCRTDITYSRLDTTDDFEEPPDYYTVEPAYYEEYDVEEEFVPAADTKVRPVNRNVKLKTNKKPPFIHSWMSKALRNSKRE